MTDAEGYTGPPPGERGGEDRDWQNRIVGHGAEAPDQIMANPRNWRIHPSDQQLALAGSLGAVGWVRSVTVNRRTGFLVDGHARVLLAMRHGEASIPVEYVDISDEEEALVLATLDPLAAMAGADAQMFAGLMASIETNDAALSGLLDAIGQGLGIGASNVTSEGEGAGDQAAAPSLAERFGVPPFSVLDARQGYWQDRKRAWVALGIQSELGRGENALDISATMAGITDPAEREAWNAERREGPRRKPGDNLLGLSEQAEAYRNSEGEYAKRGKGRGRGGRASKNAGKPDAVTGGLTFVSGAPRTDPVSKAILKVGSSGKASTLGSTPGREGKLLGGSAMDGSWVRRVKGEGYTGLGANSNGTSIFDPVLCELVYRWFTPPAGRILDPFSGGSVRGIVASILGRQYVGVDLRPEQVAANVAQAQAIIGGRGLDGPIPEWRIGDAADLDALDDGGDEAEAFDLIFTCPPYGPLEIYSDDAADLSQIAARDPEAFLAAYRASIRQALARLAPDRFAVFVVGDYRRPDGHYANFIGETVKAFEDAGAALYNEAILVTAVGSLPIRVGRQFANGRKLGKTHQNVLTFVKGDWRAAVAACGAISVEVPLAPEEGAEELDDGSADPEAEDQAQAEGADNAEGPA